VLRALADAGLEKRELDGLLLNAGISQGIDLSLAQTLGLGELAVLTQMNAYGSTAGQMVQYAALAVHHGLARHVACVFADAPLVEADLAEVAFAPGSFDGVISFDAIWNVPREEHGQVFARMREWLAPGGDVLWTIDDFADADNDGNAVFGEGAIGHEAFGYSFFLSA